MEMPAKRYRILVVRQKPLNGLPMPVWWRIYDTRAGAVTVDLINSWKLAQRICDGLNNGETLEVRRGTTLESGL